MPQSDDMMSRSAGMYRNASRNQGGNVVRTLHLKIAMVENADDDLLVCCDVPNGFEVPGSEDVVSKVSASASMPLGLESRLIALHVLENALLRRIAPAGVAPHFGFVAKALDRVVEDRGELLDVELAEKLAAHRHHMDVRLLHLQDRATGIGEIVQLLIERVAERPCTLDRVFVVIVVDGSRQQFRQYGTELHRARRHPLRRFPHRRILQIAWPQGTDNAREHARLFKVMQDVAARISNGADIVHGGSMAWESPAMWVRG